MEEHSPECFIPYDIPNDTFLFSHVRQYFVSLTVKMYPLI